MHLIHALILGVVEGLTEYLPISSTGHLILTSRLLELEHTEFIKTFEICIQSGAILSVVVLYWKRLFVDTEVIKRVAAAFVPTALIGFILYKSIKKILLGNTDVVLWALLVGGVLLIVFEWLYKEKPTAVDDITQMTYKQAAMIGLCQSLAMIPGVSRSAATILGGLLQGLSRKMIVEFSFLLAVPTMFAATALDIIKNPPNFSEGQSLFLMVGFLSAFVVGILSIRFFLAYIRHNNFIIFGIYRIVIALILFNFL